MQGRRRIFLVGEENGIANSAHFLVNQFYPNANGETLAANLSQQDCFSQLTESELQEMVFLGHGSTQTYGGYSAKEFAYRMVEHFQHNQDKMGRVKHLYLIGCDMGVIDESGKSLAQNIADELHHNGFTNVQLHSIAQPEGALGESLYVEVIGKPAVANFMSKTQPGFISAYLFNREDGNTFFDLLKNENKNYRQIHQYKTERAFIFVNEVHPKDELDKPHNVFIPQENPEQRKQRIAAHPHTLVSNQQREAVDLLKQRREYENSKKDKTLVRNLDFIITQISRAQPKDWLSLITKYKSYLEVKLLGITFNKKSNTLKLLGYLSKNDFDKARKVIVNQKATSKENEKPVKRISSMISKLPAEHKERKDKKTQQQKAAIQDSVNSIAQKSIVESNVEREKERFRLAQNIISAAINVYEDKISDLSRGCFSCFNWFEIATKTKKKNALNELLQEKDFMGMQMHAAYLMEDSRVMLSWNTSVTADLLYAIVYEPDNLAKIAERNANIKPLDISTREDDYAPRIK